MILGANSHHSTPTPSFVLLDTYAAIGSARCHGDGILILTSMRERSPRSTLAFMSAPLKLVVSPGLGDDVKSGSGWTHLIWGYQR
jgi:hypothetical protein